MDNSGIDGDYRSGIENQFYIHLDVAKAFKLVIPKNGSPGSDDKGYQFSSLVMAEHFRDPMSSTAAISGVQRLWSVKNADEYDLKINNEEVVYMDVFPRKRKDVMGMEKEYSLEELTIEYLKENYVDIELGVAKTFDLVKQI